VAVTGAGGSVRAIVFRLEGVLIDSGHAGYAAWHYEFFRRGLHLPIDYWGDLRARYPVERCDARVMRLLQRRSPTPVPDGADLLDRVRRRRRRLELAQPLRPGVARWLRDAGDLGLRVFVASDRPLPRLDEELARLRLDGRGHERFSFADAPAGQGYRSLAANARLPGPALVAVEDAPSGVRAARAAGLRCVASPHRVSTHRLTAGPGVVVAEPPWVDLSGALAGLTAADRPRPGPIGTDVAGRIAGSLGALALGDAIGKVVNKRSAGQLEADTGDLLDRLARAADPPPASVFTGCVTDDTVLLLALIDCVLADGRVRRDSYERALRAVNPRGGRQIYKLRADASDLHVAQDGNTNGCVPRCAAVAYTNPTSALGDLCYDVLKVVTLTHGGAEAVVAALLFGVVLARALDGEPVRSVREWLPDLHAPLARMAGGGEVVCDLVRSGAAQADRVDSVAHYVDVLEGSVGMAMAARSSVVAAICLGLSGFPFPAAMATLMRRQAHWDLDSTAAIYGALAGAFQPDEVPPGWVARVARHSGRDFTATSRSLAGLRAR
jgi:ADP-ribosylglycohydrolase/beta-phosphoglucomutase-like phosphatase (HAD superfamily)